MSDTPNWIYLLLAAATGAMVKLGQERVDYWTPSYDKWTCRYLRCSLDELKEIRSVHREL